ncbi:MAG TPA: FAD-binding protein [Stellaceae bacterium]|jgi:succinate dehydrogenase/fumarate reductase flavoprotein subunit|nr:FAD-binding protein [Stellaceae bacterium]
MTNGITSSIEFDVDVLVIGGGPAGAWAACSAAANKARVVLVDKGYCGSSGATAAAGTGVWYIQPEKAAREKAMASRDALGGFLANRSWMRRVLDRTYDSINTLAEWGYPFPVDDFGNERRNNLKGPEYMRLMRRRVKESGVRILDHSPALELLVDEHGAVAGARGVRRQQHESWTVRAKAVVIATGGCAFLSKALGCNPLTGDGLLLGAEAGAELSGMEFSNAYAIAPEFSSVTKTLFYNWATFFYEDGSVIEGASGHHRSVIAKTLLKQRVYAILDRADEGAQTAMRGAQPNFFLPFDRAGHDPFKQRFPVTLRLEGTVRGTGGLRIVDDTCATSVPGLYAAGDAATRELICGGFTGGGSHNAAWAMSSGFFAGAGAADYARQSGIAAAPRRVQGAAKVALRSSGAYRYDPSKVAAVVKAEVHPYDKNYFRTGDVLTQSLVRLDRAWREVREADASLPEEQVQAREAAAMLATARWMYRSALARSETRGMHKREDFPRQDVNQRHYLACGGLDEVWVSSRRAAGRQTKEVAA